MGHNQGCRQENALSDQGEQVLGEMSAATFTSVGTTQTAFLSPPSSW